MGLAHGPRLSLLEFYKSQVSKPQTLSKLVESIAKTITPAFEDRLRIVLRTSRLVESIVCTHPGQNGDEQVMETAAKQAPWKT